MIVRILNWQHVYKSRPYQPILSDIVKRALQTSDDVTSFIDDGVRILVNIIFAGPSQMKKLNADTMGINATTDVLSFPMLNFRNGQITEPPGEYDFEEKNGLLRLHLGDIVICPKRADEQAETLGQSLERELQYLAMHGAFHLIGYDHIDAADARLMRAMEKRLIEQEESDDE